MTQADRVHSTPPINTSSTLTEVAHGLFELEGQLLRVRDLTYALLMLASSSEVPKKATDAIEALTEIILDDIDELVEERTRLFHLARQSDGGEHDEG
jgi:hypothetical protein